MKFPSPEFDDAVAALCHDTISDEALAELHKLLRADEPARDEYLWRVEVHGELASGKLDFRHLSACDETDDNLEALAMPACVATRAGKWRYRSTVVAVILVVLVVLIGGPWVWHASQTSPVESEISPVQPKVVAQFAELRDCRWMVPKTRVRSGDAIQNGQRIELSSGSAKVRFNSGARVTILGPTIVEPRSDNSVFLTLGEVHLVAETPESRGFTVVTPTSKFVDISTAFTARVSPDGMSRLEVSEGEVDVVLEGIDNSRRLKAGQTLYVEPGKRTVITRIESGDGTAAFRFPTIGPPSREDYADKALGHAKIRVAQGELKNNPGNSGPVEVLLDGEGQSRQDAPHQSAFFRDGSSGSFLVDLGQAISITRINSYTWHQHYIDQAHRHRATQRFTLYGFAGDDLPDLAGPRPRAGWTRIARVNSDKFFDVDEPLERPAQQACSVTSARGEIGRFRYLLWVTKPGAGDTFFGEFDVFGSPNNQTLKAIK